MSSSEREKLLGESPMPGLLLRLSFPAMVAMLVNAFYNIVDTLFVGRGVGPMGIGGLTVAFPIQLLIMSFAMLVGTGAASIISRALGARDYEHANRVTLTAFLLSVLFSLSLAAAIWLGMAPLLRLLGADGELLPVARDYLSVILLGTPFISAAMAGNNIIRAEGQARVAMTVMLAGTGLNIILDPIFIFGLSMGVRGAAIATVLAQLASFLYMVAYFRSGKSILSFRSPVRKMRELLAGGRQILILGTPAFFRQLAGSFLMVLVNNSLMLYGGATSIAAFGIVHRLLMFALMPIFGIAQGFQPIAGYNFGARRFDRVRKVFILASLVTTLMGALFFLVAEGFAPFLVGLFSTDTGLLRLGSRALRIVALASPLIGFQVIGATYFMALGKALPSLLLSLSRQVLLLIPIVLILPRLIGIDGVWISFPSADLLAGLITAICIWREFRAVKRRRERVSSAKA